MILSFNNFDVISEMMLFDKISKTLEEFGKSKVQKNPKLEKYLSNLNDQYYKYKYSPKFQTKYKGNYNEGKLQNFF